MSVYFYCGHIERIGSSEKIGSFSGVVTASNAVTAYECAQERRMQEIKSVTELSCAGFSAIFHKFEKVE